MKALLTICLLFAINTAYSQCISLKQMRAFFYKDLEERENFMDARGYAVSFMEDPELGMVWENKPKKTMFVLDNDESGKARMTTYSMHIAKSCYDSFKSEVVNLGMVKDEQFYKQNTPNANKFYTFYSNKSYGIMMVKESLNGMARYRVAVMNKISYKSKIADAKSGYDL